MGNFPSFVNVPPLVNTPSLLDHQPASAPTSLPPVSQTGIQEMLKGIELGSGDTQSLKAFKQGACDANICFVDLPQDRSFGELMNAARQATSAADLETLAYEVQDRAEIGDLAPGQACDVMAEVLMNAHVAPRTVNELAQYAVNGLSQKDNQAAFGVNPAYADLVSTLTQGPVQTPEATATIAAINPDRFPPTIAPFLRQPVQKAGERLRQSQFENIKATQQQIHHSQSPAELSTLTSQTLAKLQAGKLDESDGSLILGEILANKAVSPQTSSEIVNYGLQGLQNRDPHWAGGVNAHYVDLLSSAAASPSTPKQALAILAALRPDQYPPTVAPQLRSVVSAAASQLRQEP